MQDKLYLGNIDAKRDWGYAKEYVEGMWRMLQTEKPDDFVLATNETNTVREFVEIAFEFVGIRIYWKGEGEQEKGYNAENGQVLVEIDPRYYRPTEVDLLLGDPRKAKDELGWQPKTSFKELVEMMVNSDWEKVRLRGY